MFIDAAPVEMEVSGAQGPAGSGLTGEISYLSFDPTPTGVPTAEGTVSWNSDDHTLNLQTDIAGVVQQIGQEQHIRVRNTTGSTIQNGSVVYLSGAGGQRPLVALADADNDTHVLSTIGVATADIDHNSFGYVTTSGLVRGVNTNGMTEGSPIYLDTTAGAFTQSVPTGNKVRVGWCIVAGNSGTILVHVDKQSVKSADVVDATDSSTSLTIARRDSSGICSFTSLRITSGSFAGSVGVGAPLTGNQTYTLPDATGTLALTSDLTTKANLAGGNTFTGAQVFNDATRPTSAGTGTPAATSLVTRTDAENILFAGRDTRYLVNDTSWTSANTGTGTSSSGGQLAASSGATSGGVGHIRTGGSAPWIYCPAGGNSKTYDYSVKFRIGFTIAMRYGSSETTYSSCEGYFNFGQSRVTTAYGPITVKGVAIKIENGVCYGQTHDGTTLRTTATPLFTAVGSTFPMNRIDIVNTGAGTVEFWCNGVLIETLAGPTGALSGTDYSGNALMATNSTNKTFDMFVNFPITINY